MSNSGFTFRRVREEMIETLLELGIKDFRVLDAISQIPRHTFLDEALWSRAYENRPLTIGYKQTISQPYIVARMTELLISHTKTRGKVFDKVLDFFPPPCCPQAANKSTADKNKTKFLIIFNIFVPLSLFLLLTIKLQLNVISC